LVGGAGPRDRPPFVPSSPCTWRAGPVRSDDLLDEAGSADKLTGASGHDWFIIGSLDRITDANSSGKDGDKVPVA